MLRYLAFSEPRVKAGVYKYTGIEHNIKSIQILPWIVTYISISTLVPIPLAHSCGRGGKTHPGNLLHKTKITPEQFTIPLSSIVFRLTHMYSTVQGRWPDKIL